MLTLHNHSNSHGAAAPLLFLFSSILNKLTPEKFDKLCLELLNVGVDSKLVLKGIILLVNPCLFLIPLLSRCSSPPGRLLRVTQTQHVSLTVLPPLPHSGLDCRQSPRRAEV